MLRSIFIKTTATMIITRRGLRFTVQDESKCLQASSFAERQLFTSFRMENEDVPSSLCFKLPDFIKVLTMFISVDVKPNDKRVRGINSPGQRVKISYESEDNPLLLELKDGKIATNAKISTHRAEEISLYSFTRPIVNKIIMSPSLLIDFWKCMDLQAENIILVINKEEIILRTHSERADFDYKILVQSEDIEQFRCDEDLICSYKLSLFKMTVKALLESKKLSLRTDCEGLLCFQFIIPIDENQDCFVEFYLIPNVLDD